MSLEQTNLDAETPDDLWKFASELGGVRPIRGARMLFPNRPRGYVRAAVSLRCYAENKATAIACRLRGDIPAAQIYETICDRIYDSLPDFARAW